MTGAAMPRRSRAARAATRVLDCVAATAGLVAAAMPLAIAAAAIKLSSPGDVIYRQIRVGRGGRPFAFYKLRTMRCASDGPQVTANGDPRVTAVGRVLRRLKADEIPQLWNVLAGDMSLIGPRPEVPRFVAHYTAEQRRILDATPGLASLSQLVYANEAEALRGRPDSEDAYVRYVMPLKIAADLEYERTRTFASDARLMVEIALLIAGRSTRADAHFSIPPADSRA